MDRWVTPHERVTSPTWGPPLPCKQDLNANIGVIFDNTLTMSFHINNIVRLAFYHLRNIAKIR